MADSMHDYVLDQNRALSPEERERQRQQRREDCNKRIKKVIPPPIKVVGVWDTVAALGVPGKFRSKAMRDFVDFYDPGLCSNIQFAFHALSLEEDRKDFLPTLWYRQRWNDPASHGAETSSENHIDRKQQVLKQVWFQGCHSDVGGSYHYHGLSDITLAWMVSHLVDPHRLPDGSMTSVPLLDVDVEFVRRIMDGRRAWAKQIAHRSRYPFEFQASRKVRQSTFNQGTLRNWVWASMVQTGATNESIHPSVVLGGRIDPQTHPAFQEVRAHGHGRLERMWAEASDLDKALRPTEQYLRQTRPSLEPQLCVPTDELGENPVDRYKHPGFFRIWDMVNKVALVPSAVLVTIINIFIWNPWPPEGNLKITLPQWAWWKFGDKFAGYPSEGQTNV